MTRVFQSKVIREQLGSQELQDLVTDFKNYKATGKAPDTFGRDEYYDHPHTLPIVKAEEVQHIHLEEAENPWPIYRIQFKKTSNFHLVYCQGVNHHGCYLLMAILKPNAHELANNNDCMFNLGKVAESFRLQF